MGGGRGESNWDQLQASQGQLTLATILGDCCDGTEATARLLLCSSRSRTEVYIRANAPGMPSRRLHSKWQGNWGSIGRLPVPWESASRRDSYLIARARWTLIDRSSSSKSDDEIRNRDIAWSIDRIPIGQRAVSYFGIFGTVPQKKINERFISRNSSIEREIIRFDEIFDIWKKFRNF